MSPAENPKLVNHNIKDNRQLEVTKTIFRDAVNEDLVVTCELKRLVTVGKTRFQFQ